ncbi:hypothetical protein [Streptomyces sp.]|uniref:hypothetical protein n=1 Tax=Streptomyces sp. TaxID=1931 RepID=UPI002F425032
MTTHFSRAPVPRRGTGAARPPRTAARSAPVPRGGAPAGSGAQTRLPWWAVALPALAFAALLALLTGGPADASAATPAGHWFGWLAPVVPDLIGLLP